jgi:SNF2 family DNA or RNA helicase
MSKKVAALNTELQEHQKKALARALVSNLLLAHSTGSGKTLTSIAIADALNKPVTVLTPASLVDNFKKEIAKHVKKGTGPSYDVKSINKAVLDNYQIPKGNTVILDEIHNLRNSGTAKQKYIKSQLDRAGRIIGLTGTPAYNDISDWAPLVNIVANKNVVPAKASDFRATYIETERVRQSALDRLLHGRSKAGTVEHLKHGADLRRRLTPWIDIFDKDVEKAARNDVYIDTTMSPEQVKLYKAFLKKMPESLRRKLNQNLPPNRSELGQLNTFLIGPRQVVNTAEGYDIDAPAGDKIVKASENLKEAIKKNPKLRAVVYSNFLDSGVNSYARVLDETKIPYGVYTGALDPKQKKALVDNYNKALGASVLLISGAGAEGLDLKNTRLIQILEPYWNNSRIEQVIGRGIRYKAHDDLKPEERKVTVEHYRALLPEERGLFWIKKRTPSVDEYLDARSKEKQALIDSVKQTLAQ